MRTLGALGLLLALLPSAKADIFSFGCITNNLAADCATGVAQLSVDVTNAGTVMGVNQVAFKFNNIGPNASSITDVYFDDGTLLGIASITQSAGVNFTQGATPPDLPGGNSVSPPFNVTAGFLADSTPPPVANGVNNTATGTEWLTITFNLISGQTFADTLNALSLAGAPGGLRIGIHVQGFNGGGSESFINGPTPLDPQGEIPEPSSVFLLGTACAGVLHLIRKRRAA